MLSATTVTWQQLAGREPSRNPRCDGLLLKPNR
jgi:hypothetical protein